MEKSIIKIIGTAIVLTSLGTGYVLSEKDKAELEAKIDEMSYIRAKTVIDQRGNMTEIASKIVGSTSPERLVIGGIEYFKK